MKEKIFILLLLSNFVFANERKNLRIDFKSNAEFNMPKRGKLWFAPSIKYTLADLTVSSLDSKWKFNVMLKGKRSIITSKDTAFESENLYVQNKESKPEEIIEKTSNFFGDTEIKYEVWHGTKYANTYKFPTPRLGNTNSVEQAIFNDEKQIHQHSHEDPDHDHEHTHEHTHEHNHSNVENRQDLNILSSRYKKLIKKTNDLQAKASVQYFNGLNGFKYTQYLTSFLEKDDEVRRYGGDGILELKNTNVFNDKYSLSFIPRLYTRKIFKPLAVELDTDFRYKYNDDTVIGAYVYNGMQLNNISERLNFKNRVELFYDKNKEAKRFHKFYEILDHEHEKIDQIKLFVAYTHKGNYQKNQFLELTGLQFNKKDDKHQVDIGLKYKKTNLLIKDLVFENETKFKYRYETEKISDGTYSVSNEYKFENIIDRDIMIKNGKINGASPHELVDKKIYKTKDGYEVHRVFETIREYKENEFENKVSKKKIRYLEIIKAIPSKNQKLVIDKSKTKNNINIKNDTKIEYKNFMIENKLDYSTLLSKVEHNVKNKVKISYKKEIGKNVIITPYLEDEVSHYSSKNDYYTINSFKPGVDIKYIYDKIENIKLTFGLDTAYEIIQRKAPENRLLGRRENNNYYNKFPDLKDQVKNEADKWVYGASISFKPYAQVDWNINNNLVFKVDTEVQMKKEKTVVATFDGYYPASKEFGRINANAKLKCSLEYIR